MRPDEIATKADIEELKSLLKNMSATQVEPEEVMTTTEAAKFIGVDEDTLYKWRSGKTYKNPLPAYGTGKVVRYLKSDLIKFLKDHPINELKSIRKSA